jgi:hypothetical protein
VNRLTSKQESARNDRGFYIPLQASLSMIMFCFTDLSRWSMFLLPCNLLQLVFIGD